MNEKNTLVAPQYLTIKQFVDTYPWPSLGSLRWIRVMRHKNGFKKAFVKVGGTVLIDVKAFWDCVAEKKEEK